jgi:hypothetical protein
VNKQRGDQELARGVLAVAKLDVLAFLKAYLVNSPLAPLDRFLGLDVTLDPSHSTLKPGSPTRNGRFCFFVFRPRVGGLKQR